MLDAAAFNAVDEHENNLCLGLVCIAQHQRLDVALQQLRAQGTLFLGEPQGNRIPACVFTRRGQDRELLAQLEDLDAVMKVEVAYAHTIDEDEVQ